MRLLIEGHLRGQHPDWDDARIQREVAQIMMGPWPEKISPLRTD